MEETFERDPWGRFYGARRYPTADSHPQLGDCKVPASDVLRLLGCKCRRTLTRLVEDPREDFPQPITIKGRWLFEPREIVAWVQRRRTIAEHEAAKKRTAQAKAVADAQATKAAKAVAAGAEPRPRGRPRKATVEKPPPRPRGRPRIKRVLVPPSKREAT
jgi:predicted DNA-binding transcriptional regulator AlpA